MELGGLHHDKERVFLLSTTHGAENHSLAAAIQTMQIYRRDNVVEYLYSQGERLRAGINRAIESLDLVGYFEVLGRPSNLVYATRDPIEATLTVISGALSSGNDPTRIADAIVCR